MNLYFDRHLATGYNSKSQQIRVMSEAWIIDNLYCLNCGEKLIHAKNNMPVCDFICKNCNFEYELKSTKNFKAKKVNGGSYRAMYDKIYSGINPSFIILNYYPETLKVKNLLVVPKQFFTTSIIEKRKPLRNTAKRKGWTGCLINLGDIPDAGKIYIIKDEINLPKDEALRTFCSTKFLYNIESISKGWLLDIIICIEKINKDIFSLNDIYQYENFLKLKHPDNNNIRAKIRQQLQILRDKGYVTFPSRGNIAINKNEA